MESCQSILFLLLCICHVACERLKVSERRLSNAQHRPRERLTRAMFPEDAPIVSLSTITLNHRHGIHHYQEDRPARSRPRNRYSPPTQAIFEQPAEPHGAL